MIATSVTGADRIEIGIVVALPLEADPIGDRLTGLTRIQAHKRTIYRGSWQGREIGLMATGPGRTSTCSGLDLLLAGHRPDVVISAGLAGGLDPDLVRGDVVLASDVATTDGSRRHIALTDLSIGDSPAPPGQRLLMGSLLTVDQVIASIAEKARLHEHTRAVAVDMETYWAAAWCHAHRQRFLALRAISDDAHDVLPPEVLSLTGPTGTYRLGAAIGSILRRPASIGTLWALRERAILAADRLSSELGRLIAECAPPERLHSQPVNPDR